MSKNVDQIITTTIIVASAGTWEIYDLSTVVGLSKPCLELAVFNEDPIAEVVGVDEGMHAEHDQVKKCVMIYR
jgi:hypothetical protein